MRRYGFSIQNIKDILVDVDDVQYIKKLVEDGVIGNIKDCKKINLPDGITIGIEIESEGKYSRDIKHMQKLKDNWQSKEEFCLYHGVEVVSPIIKSEEHKENEIYEICEILNYCDQICSKRCGGHIHIGADYLTNINAWKNLIEIWANTENILYIISNREGEKIRERIIDWAQPFSPKIELVLEKGEVDLEDEEDLDEFCKELKVIQESEIEPFSEPRYSGINFCNLGDSEKDTIEFRTPNGTINPDTWIENINLFGGIVQAAQELSVIEEKMESGQELTDQEVKKFQAFKRIKTIENKPIYENEKLKALMDLVIAPDEQYIYLNRYKTNRKLLKGKNIVENVNPISITRNQIGKIAFYGQERVTGEEYLRVSQIIENELENEKHTIRENE